MEKKIKLARKKKRKLYQLGKTHNLSELNFCKSVFQSGFSRETELIGDKE